MIQFINNININLPQINNMNILEKWKKSFLDTYNMIIDDINKYKLTKYFILNKEPYKNMYKELLTNPFISYDIMKEIENGFMYNYSYIFKLKKIKLTLNIKSHKIISDHKLVKILAYCYIIGIYYKKTKPLNINLILTNIKKMSPKNNIFGPNEVNSGSSDGTTIYIWRKEEFLKLILHETIHHYDIDANVSLGVIDNMFRVNNDVFKLFECFTETLAVLYNTMLVSYYNDSFYKLLRLEQIYSMYMVAKIMHSINGTEDFKDIFISSTPIVPFILNQSTAVFEYYFLKSASIVMLDMFLDYIYNKSIYNKSKYEVMLINAITNPLYIELVNKLFKIKGDDYSMRMTLL